MFCKNCGAMLQENANVCTQCGAPVGAGNQYCFHCGQATGGARFCANCGAPQDAAPGQTPAYSAPANGQQKSKLAAVILAFLLGYLGIHNFYLGYTSKGVAQLLLTLLGGWLFGLGAVIAGIWALVEAIQLLTGSIDRDANGVMLKKEF